MRGAGQEIVQYPVQKTLPGDVALGRDQSQTFIVSLRDSQRQPPHAVTSLRQ